jgi:hypothetical protein
MPTLAPATGNKPADDSLRESPFRNPLLALTSTYAFMAGRMRVNDELLKTLPPSLVRLTATPLEDSPIQPSGVREPHEPKRDIPAYSITADLKYSEVTPEADKLVDFEPGGGAGRTMTSMLEHIALAYFPETASMLSPKGPEDYSPRQDFLTQQFMLGLLSMDGFYQLPDVTLQIDRTRDGKERYQTMKVDARPVFASGKFVKTRCHLDVKTIDKTTYLDLSQRRQLVSPLPDELLQMVQARLMLQQKALSSRSSTANLGQEPNIEARLPDTTPIDYEADLSGLFNISAFMEAIKALPETTESIEVIRQDDDFIVSQLRAVVQDELKKRLWPHIENMQGTVRIYPVRSRRQTGDTFSLRAACREHQKYIRPLNSEEIESFLSEEKMAALHQPHANKDRAS